MEEAVKAFSKTDVEEGKKSIVLFPGVTRAFKTAARAVDYLDNRLATDDKDLFRVLYVVKTGGDQSPVGVRKVIGHDADGCCLTDEEMKPQDWHSGNRGLCDALF